MDAEQRRVRIAARLVLEAASQRLEPPRIFIAGPGGTLCAQASGAVSRAYDLMVMDGVPPQTAADMATAAERGGRDPVEFARHFVKLRQASREARRSARHM